MTRRLLTAPSPDPPLHDPPAVHRPVGSTVRHVLVRHNGHLGMVYQWQEMFHDQTEWRVP